MTKKCRKPSITVNSQQRLLERPCRGAGAGWRPLDTRHRRRGQPLDAGPPFVSASARPFTLRRPAAVLKGSLLSSASSFHRFSLSPAGPFTPGHPTALPQPATTASLSSAPPTRPHAPRTCRIVLRSFANAAMRRWQDHTDSKRSVRNVCGRVYLSPETTPVHRREPQAAIGSLRAPPRAVFQPMAPRFQESRQLSPTPSRRRVCAGGGGGGGGAPAPHPPTRSVPRPNPPPVVTPFAVFAARRRNREVARCAVARARARVRARPRACWPTDRHGLAATSLFVCVYPS